MKTDKETIRNIAIGVGKVFVYGSLTLLTMKLNKETRNIYYDEYIDRDDCVEYDYDYNDAIDELIDSDMNSYHKDCVLSMMKRNMSKEYYKAVASIANGDDSDYHKVSMIRKLYDNEARAE